MSTAEKIKQLIESLYNESPDLCAEAIIAVVYFTDPDEIREAVGDDPEGN